MKEREEGWGRTAHRLNQARRTPLTPRAFFFTLIVSICLTSPASAEVAAAVDRFAPRRIGGEIVVDREDEEEEEEEGEGEGEDERGGWVGDKEGSIGDVAVDLLRNPPKMASIRERRAGGAVEEGVSEGRVGEGEAGREGEEAGREGGEAGREGGGVGRERERRGWEMALSTLAVGREKFLLAETWDRTRPPT
jgi:hypothetical protein